MTAEPLTRRAFLRLALLPLAASAAAALAGCRIASADKDEPAAPQAEGDEVGFVHDNHMHEAILPRADLEAGNPVAIRIQGRSEHDHGVELTAAQLADIRAGRQVKVRSSLDMGHYHNVVFNFD